MGGEFTAKDFRTWHATLQALRLLHGLPVPERGGERALRRCVNRVVADVAAGLRNTPAVCRKSYTNPAVFAAWRTGAIEAPGKRAAAHTLLRLLR